MELPISACLKEICCLPRNKGGMGGYSFKNQAEKLRLVKRCAMLHSKDDEITQVRKESEKLNIEIDEILVSQPSKRQATIILDNRHVQAAWIHLNSLVIQGQSVSTIVAEINKKDIEFWAKVLERCSNTIFNFAHKALLQVLPTAANLARWKKLPDPNCQLCKLGHKQTNKHVLSSCPSQTALQRFTLRHNEVLLLIVSWLRSVISATQELYADIEYTSYSSTSELFNSLRPDIAILDLNTVTILELTICHETNLHKSKSYKLDKYKNIVSCCSSKSLGKTISIYTIEVSTIGLISKTQEFTDAVGLPRIPPNLKERITRTVLDSSYKIYCGRNNA